jgi:two-component system, response regulator PdtaR
MDHQFSLAAARDKLKPERIRDRGEGTSGKIVLPMVRTAVPDVILMAVGLPDVDGIETSRDLMKAHPLPIVLITSHYDAATIERAKRAGILREASQGAKSLARRSSSRLGVFTSSWRCAKRIHLKETSEVRKLIERAKGLNVARVQIINSP